MSETKIPKGYKKTEVGVIPAEWEVQILKDCCKKITDGTHDTPKPVRSGVPFLTAIHVKDNHIDFENCLYLSLFDHKIIYNRCNPEKNDVLFVNIGAGVATTAVVNVEFEFSLKNVALLKPNAKKTDGHFINYSLWNRKDKITQELSNGGAQPFLSLSQIGGISLPIPPLPEQRAIATALSDVDALIAGLDQLIAKKRDLKQAAMQQLLTGQKRLPGFQGEWVEQKLGEIGEFKNGINKDAKDFGHGSPFVNLMDVFGVSVISKNEGFGLINSSENDKQTYDLRSGDVVFIRSSVKPSGVGLTAVIENDLPETVYSGFLIRFRDRGVLDLGFKKHCFYEEGFRKRLISLSSVSANTNINQDNLGLITLSLPPSRAEQASIATVLSDMDTELTALEQRRDKTRALKQGMMQELLTGKTRLI